MDPIVEPVSKIDSGDGGPPCIRLFQFQWMNKYISLMNTEGIVVATGIVRAFQQEVSFPLGETDVGIFILELNGDSCVSDDWRFSVRCWRICQVLYDNAGLFL
jgi:hypothetical protein